MKNLKSKISPPPKKNQNSGYKYEMQNNIASILCDYVFDIWIFNMDSH